MDTRPFAFTVKNWHARVSGRLGNEVVQDICLHWGEGAVVRGVPRDVACFPTFLGVGECADRRDENALLAVFYELTTGRFGPCVRCDGRKRCLSDECLDREGIEHEVNREIIIDAIRKRFVLYCLKARHCSDGTPISAEADE